MIRLAEKNAAGQSALLLSRACTRIVNAQSQVSCESDVWVWFNDLKAQSEMRAWLDLRTGLVERAWYKVLTLVPQRWKLS